MYMHWFTVNLLVHKPLDQNYVVSILSEVHGLINEMLNEVYFDIKMASYTLVLHICFCANSNFC